MIKKVLVSLLFLLSILVSASYAKHIYRIVIVNSYEIDQLTGVDQERGFINGLTSSFKYQIWTIYLQTKKVFLSETEKQFIAQKAYQEILRLKPDIVVLLDDNAFRYVGIPYLFLHKNKFVTFFSGINRPLKSYFQSFPDIKHNYGKTYIGLEEDQDPTQFFRFLQCYERYTGKQYRLVIFYDDSSTSLAVTNMWLQYCNKFHTVYKLQNIKSVEQLRNSLYRLKPNDIIVSCVERLRDELTGEVYSRINLIGVITSNNRSHLEVTSALDSTKFKILFSTGISLYRLGFALSRLVNNYLLSKKFVNFQAAKFHSGLVINRQRQRQLMIGFPIQCFKYVTGVYVK